METLLDETDVGMEMYYEPITRDDRRLLANLGCPWPDTADEEAWLAGLNGLIATGSQRIRPERPEAEKAEIVAAREAFFCALPALRSDVTARLKAGSAPNLPKSSTAIGTLRALYARNVDGVSAVNTLPALLTHGVDTIIRHLDGLDKLGFDSTQLVNANVGCLTLSTEAVQERLQAMYAAVRAWGWPDYKAYVNRMVTELPTILSSKSDRTRLLARIATRLLPQYNQNQIRPADIRTLYIATPEMVVAAYLQRGLVIRSIAGLIYYTRRNEHLDREALKGLIAQHPDDPVVKAYLRGYPIDDPEAVRYAYSRHVRARDRRKEREIDIDWEGPECLGDPELPVLDAYRQVIASPELTAVERERLDSDILQGDQAGQQLADIEDAPVSDEQRRLKTVAETSQHARRVLVARHLGIVV
ncbi:MAG: hypothetical protein AAB834_05145, partial [Patescibacteria group bacterium]